MGTGKGSGYWRRTLWGTKFQVVTTARRGLMGTLERPPLLFYDCFQLQKHVTCLILTLIPHPNPYPYPYPMCQPYPSTLPRQPILGQIHVVRGGGLQWAEQLRSAGKFDFCVPYVSLDPFAQFPRTFPFCPAFPTAVWWCERAQKSKSRFRPYHRRAKTFLSL